EVEVPKQIAAFVNEVEVIAPRAGHDAHEVLAVKGGERIGGALDGARLPPQQLAVPIVTGLPQPCNLLRRRAAFGEQVPGAPILPEKVLEVLRFGQRHAGRRHDLLCGLKVEPFGVDENAVVVPEERLDYSCCCSQS